ncbi:MAG: acyl-CoA desaturase [bacterium]|jgi:stearoyl-CoA desaturase (Delta-9 desaturase)
MTTKENPLSPMNLIKQSAFWMIHLGCFAVFWVGFSWTALLLCVALYAVRMFGITGVYHRYFSHRSYQTSRWFQFVLAFLGATSAQKGPIWWASHHRHHHKHSDTEEDIHPPGIYGLWWAHVGWVLSTQYGGTREELVKDLVKFPELRLLDVYHLVPPLCLIFATLGLGFALEAYAPGLHTSASQLFVWGFCISTTLLYHGTFCINSFAHVLGRPRFETGDDSKNSFLLALITLGEGWHNNHHRYPGSERQGFYWWEIDISHYTLKGLSWLGLVWDLREPPERIYQEARDRKAQLKAA